MDWDETDDHDFSDSEVDYYLGHEKHKKPGGRMNIGEYAYSAQSSTHFEQRKRFSQQSRHRQAVALWAARKTESSGKAGDLKDASWNRGVIGYDEKDYAQPAGGRLPAYQGGEA